MTRLDPRRLRSAEGQTILEFAMMLPLVVVLVLGVVELSWALLDQHVVTKLSREGSNLISRSTSLQDAAVAMRTMATRPVDFSGSNSTLIFSVVLRVATTGASNYNRDILYQRYQYGGLSASSTLTTVGGGSFGGAPNYQAANPDSDTSLQLTNLPTGLNTLGGMLYITEIYTTHTLITPFNRFGISVPSTLYSIAYF
jgi:Flp pilus assembly protein TadG